MNKKNVWISTIIITLSFATLAIAADKKPLSPPAKAEASISGKNITIDYSSPRMRDRAIMGGLVPYNKVWRTGANAATTLKTDADLMIGSIHVPAGEYTIFTVPGETEWTLIVSKETGQWGTNYDESKDLGRATMTVGATDSPLEEFTIELNSTTGNKGELVIKWERTVASIGLMVH